MRRVRNTATSRDIPVNNVSFRERVTTRGGRSVYRRYTYSQARARDEKRAIKALQEIRRRRRVDVDVDMGDDYMDDDVGFYMEDRHVYSETVRLVEPRHIPSRKWYDRQEAREKALRERMEEKLEAFSAQVISDDAEDNPTASSKMTLCFDFLEDFKTNVSYPLVRENAVESLLVVGWIPTAPVQPTIAVSSRTCADMHAAQVRNPSLGIRGYAEYKCDLSGIMMSNGIYQMFRYSYEFWSEMMPLLTSEVPEMLGKLGMPIAGAPVLCAQLMDRMDNATRYIPRFNMRAEDRLLLSPFALFWLFERKEQHKQKHAWSKVAG